MAILIPVDPRTQRDAWLEMRRKGIGSSDAAACVGLAANEVDPDPAARELYCGAFASPYMVYHNKVSGIELPVDEQVDWGNRLEQAIGDACQDALQQPLSTPVGIYQSEKVVWQLATLDRETPQGEPVELKNVRMGRGWGHAGSDQVPGKYLAQATHQMMVKEVDVAYVGALIGGCDFRMYHVRRDESFARLLLDSEQALWDMIQTGVPPEPDYQHPRTAEVMRMVNGLAPGTVLEFADCDGPELLHHQDQARDYVQLGKQIGELEKLRARCKIELQNLMGSHATLLLPDGTSVRRKLIHRTGYTVEAKQIEQMFITLPK